MRDLAGKRALVTGAASGIGRAIARRLAAERVDLILIDINPRGLESAAQELSTTGVGVEQRLCDVSRPEEVSRVTRGVIEQWAGVDILVNNAGVTYHGFTHTMPDDEWRRLMDINLHSHVQFTRELLPSLLARPRAHVLNLCSVLGLVGLPRVSAYCTSKFAMVGFSESLRSEYGRVGLGVTAVCPGLVKTNLFSAARPETTGGQPKTPPAWVCTTPERVARASVNAIKRNRAKVMVEPVSRAINGFKQTLPGLFDWALRLGENKRVRRREKELEELSSDRTAALRALLDREARALAERNRAA